MCGNELNINKIGPVSIKKNKTVAINKWRNEEIID